MSSNWSALHARLVRSVNRHSNLILFAKLFPAGNPPEGFRDPAQLLGWLHRSTGDPDDKNTVLARLLAKVDCESGASDLSVELLILALWPGLCRVRHRLRHSRSLDALEADLLGQTAIAIRRADAARITHVAATLLRNIERDLIRMFRRQSRACEPLEAPEFERLFPPEATGDSAARIMAAARDTLGNDGLLLFAVHIAGFSQKEAAQRMGVSHEAARKRCQRAMARLMKDFGG